MPEQGQPWTQEEWTEAQTNNPDQWGGYVPISGDQYGEEQQGWWQNVQQVGETGTPGSGLYGLPGEGDMPGSPPPEPPAEETPPDTTPVEDEDIDIDDETDETDETEEDNLIEEEIRSLNEENDIINQSYLDAIESASSDLDEYNQQYIVEIQRSFEIRRRQMEQLNRASLAGVTKAGIRSGRQRYASEIQTGILSAEEAAGIQRLNEIDAQERMLIAEAKMAATEKQFELLDKKYAAIKERQREKENMLLQLRQIAIQEEQRAMDKMRFEREKQSWAREDAGTRLESLISGGFDIDVLSDEEKSTLETDLGLLSGTLEGFYTGLKDAQAAEAMGDEIKLQQSIISLLNSTPEGMEVQIGDKTYTGLKDTTERMSYTYTDGATNRKYEVVIDKKTGEELYRKDMGQAYKYTSSSSTTDDEDDDVTESEAVSMMNEQIKEVVGSDGFVSPDDYTAARNAWIAQGFSPTVFDTKFKGFRNPNNPNYIINKQD